MDVLDLHRGLVHEHAYGERQATERHDVDGLSGSPEEEHRRKKGERDIRNDDQRSSPVPKEEQHDKSSEDSSQNSFADQSANRVRDIP
jgi:hypothetical protein